MAEQDQESVSVGLGELAIARAGVAKKRRLVAHGLGSCVAVCLWDSGSAVAGMAHVVLPGADPAGKPNAKFAQSVLPALFDAMCAGGASRDVRRYQARLAGGARILAIGGTGSLPRIGDKNIEAVKEALLAAGVRIIAEDTGGGKGRTVWFDPHEAGKIRVRTVGAEEREI
jgi:chemotaxis protein CheD